MALSEKVGLILKNRKKVFSVIVFALVVIFVPMAWSVSTSFDDVEYVSNYDADTVKVHILWVHPLLGKSISVRLAGVDAPELRSKNICEKELAQKGKLLVEEVLLSAQKISLSDCERGKFFRIVCKVFADDVDLSQLLLNRHLAVPYDGAKKEELDWCGKTFWKM